MTYLNNPKSQLHLQHVNIFVPSDGTEIETTRDAFIYKSEEEYWQAWDLEDRFKIYEIGKDELPDFVEDIREKIKVPPDRLFALTIDEERIFTYFGVDLLNFNSQGLELKTLEFETAQIVIEND